MIVVEQIVPATSEFASRFAPVVRRRRMLVHGLLFGRAARKACDLFLLLCS
jgi:hypothetical protein